MSSDWAKEALLKIKANTARLNACPLHRIEAGDYKFGQKLTCRECGGQIDGPALLQYARGYAAAGGDPGLIWPGIKL